MRVHLRDVDAALSTLRLSENIQQPKQYVPFHGLRQVCRQLVIFAPSDDYSLECPHALILFLNITLVISQVKTLRVNHPQRGFSL